MLIPAFRGRYESGATTAADGRTTTCSGRDSGRVAGVVRDRTGSGSVTIATDGRTLVGSRRVSGGDFPEERKQLLSFSIEEISSSISSSDEKIGSCFGRIIFNWDPFYRNQFQELSVPDLFDFPFVFNGPRKQLFVNFPVE